MGGTLFLVATPIGHLEDMTFRAVETLKCVSTIVAEDTRRARILCERFKISTKIVSMPAFAEAVRADGIVMRLKAGEDIALISDAGMPGISDPGTQLVQKAIQAEIGVVPIPGACAAIAALSASGLSTTRFHFVGFLPRKGKSRRIILESLEHIDGTIVIYESPERLCSTIQELAMRWGTRQGVVARELTKVHETFVRGTLLSLSEMFRDKPKGEITLLIEGRAADAKEMSISDEELEIEIERRLSMDVLSLKDLVRDIAEASGRKKSDIYAQALKIKARKNSV
ncbi:MAG: 16S rRNA (cytidine(1402)-2'-O)-methyltransferase [Myxococcaceae bacterium]|nr:16S rRNA (cytidine(1402)-2'-O)-methyltransferase [Myxococcaceae bacterium]